jgi:L-arabinose transport system permease protein
MTGVLAAVVVNHTGSPVMGVAAGILAGGLVGLFNGVAIAQLGVNSLIATLATMQIVKGLGFIICNGIAVGIREPKFYEIGQGNNPTWVMVTCFVIFGILLNRTTFGRNTLALGGNREAARLAGIRVVGIRVLIFTLQGLVSGLAGVVVAARITSGQPKPPEALELDIISACVLGGVSLTGGVGTITGTIIGVLIMGVVRNAMSLKNIDQYYQYVVSGAVLLAAVLVDRLRTRGT